MRAFGYRSCSGGACFKHGVNASQNKRDSQFDDDDSVILFDKNEWENLQMSDCDASELDKYWKRLLRFDTFN